MIRCNDGVAHAHRSSLTPADAAPKTQHARLLRICKASAAVATTTIATVCMDVVLERWPQLLGA